MSRPLARSQTVTRNGLNDCRLALQIIMSFFGMLRLIHTPSTNFLGGHPSQDYSTTSTRNCGVLKSELPKKKVPFDDRSSYFNPF